MKRIGGTQFRGSAYFFALTSVQNGAINMHTPPSPTPFTIFPIYSIYISNEFLLRLTHMCAVCHDISSQLAEKGSEGSRENGVLRRNFASQQNTKTKPKQ